MQPKPTTSGGVQEQNQLHLFVLDVLRHDAVEQVPSIVRLMNDSSGCIGWREFWPHDFSIDEVEPAMIWLIQEGYVRAFRENPESDALLTLAFADIEAPIGEDLWFGLTEKGHRLLDQWQPPKS